jgi:dihydroxyacetone kinase-like protein
MTVTTGQVRQWIGAFAAAMAEHKAELTDLDSRIGDGDHGINMDRGMRAVTEKLDAAPGQGIGPLLRTVGMTLVSTVGGASGPLYGTFFLEMGKAAGASDEVADGGWAAAVAAGVAGVQRLGKAEQGDKTMVDALVPARDELTAAITEGAPLADALIRAADAAERGLDATKPLVARKGRASYLGERSAGHLDPGAASSALLFRCAATAFSAQGGQ